MALYDYYFNTQREYQAKYGEKTLVLIEVGMFLEVYKVDNAEECIGPDIHKICSICDIQMSRKNKSITENSRANPLMAGFPSHAKDKHIQVLLNNQYTIIVIRQVTPPPNPKREITEILSPSMQITPNTPSGNFLFVSYWDFYTDTFNKRLLSLGLAGFDVSTGETWVYEVASTSADTSRAMDELMRFYQIYQPREIVFLGPNLLGEERSEIEDTLGIHYDQSRAFHLLWDYHNIRDFASVRYQNEFLQRAYADHKSMLTPIEYLNLEKYDNGRIAFTYMIQFAYEHNQSLVQYLKVPQLFGALERCILDYNSALQLQIISLQNGERPLMSILNRCGTAFGSRHFHEILLQPFTNCEYIQERYDKVAALIQNNSYGLICTELKKVFDIERMGRRMLLGQFSPADWVGFDTSLVAIAKLCVSFESVCELFIPLDFDCILKTAHNVVQEYTNKLKIDECAKYLMNDIKRTIFVKGVYPEADAIDDEFKAHYKKLERLTHVFSEIILDSARIDQNDRDGYFIQITKKRWDSILEDLKKKTKDAINVWVNGSGDEELKVGLFKAKPLSTSSAIVRISHPWIEATSDTLIKLQIKLSHCLQKCYKDFLMKFALTTKEQMRIIIQKVAEIDVLATNARNAVEYNYTRPNVISTPDGSAYVKGTKIRHPILERILNSHMYIPNDIALSASASANSDSQSEIGLLLFGMNASGKSSLMKAVGLTVIMAQAGMYVPAQSFEYSPYEYIFTRISGADNIYRGWSSFTVEMMELRNILQRCNDKSLVLGDELCAGTESISALAIVTAGIYALIKKRANFVFATHLHDLSKLSSIQEAALKNKNNKGRAMLRLAHMHVEVDKTSGKLIFDRQLREGTGSSLYGLEVCYGLGLPSDFLKKAHEVRSEIEEVSPLLQSNKQSQYNASVLIQECRVCKKERATEVHHIKEQHTATPSGFIEHFHKNNAHNLVPLCESCHHLTHFGQLKIHGYKNTSQGQILDFTLEEKIPAPKIRKSVDELQADETLQKMNDERIREGVFPYVRYNRGHWFYKKTTRSKWKELPEDTSGVISILQSYLSKSFLVKQIDLIYEYNEINKSSVNNGNATDRFEELMYYLQSILHDDSL
jgi:DNA mismatch repair protein MutS